MKYYFIYIYFYRKRILKHLRLFLMFRSNQAAIRFVPIFLQNKMYNSISEMLQYLCLIYFFVRTARPRVTVKIFMAS